MGTIGPIERLVMHIPQDNLSTWLEDVRLDLQAGLRELQRLAEDGAKQFDAWKKCGNCERPLLVPTNSVLIDDWKMEIYCSGCGNVTHIDWRPVKEPECLPF